MVEVAIIITAAVVLVLVIQIASVVGMRSNVFVGYGRECSSGVDSEPCHDAGREPGLEAR